MWEALSISSSGILFLSTRRAVYRCGADGYSHDSPWSVEGRRRSSRSYYGPGRYGPGGFLRSATPGGFCVLVAVLFYVRGVYCVFFYRFFVF